MMYYALIVLSALLYGACFTFTDIYRKLRGSEITASLQLFMTSSVSGFVIMLALNGFRLEFTLFTFVLALLFSLSALGFYFCSLRALGTINLSLFSLFSMLGGMVLPFLQGIIFFDEDISLAKIVCVILIIIALILTVERSEKRSGNGTVYYIGIFILNGICGIINKLFTESHLEKTSAAGYSILITLCSFVLSGMLLMFFKKNSNAPKNSHTSILVGALHGLTNKLTTFLLVIALAHVDASVQYPLFTGGVMIVSTIICFFGKNNPSKKEILSVIVAFIGMLALFAIPV